MVSAFMDNLKNDHYYIDRIKQDLQFIVMHMKDVTIEDLNNNDYGNVDLNIVYETLKSDIPLLLDAIN